MKNSSTHDHQEVDLQPKQQENVIGRSYECVFCKRGFNTAQALGGHMNIHRKDRIRINRPSQNQNQNNGPGYHAVATHLNYRTYFPAHSSTSTTSPFSLNGPDSGSEDHNNIRQCLNLFGDDWRMSLSLQFDETIERNKGNTEDDLDLELRLGHDP